MATAADAAPSRFRPGVPPGVCGGQLPRGSSHRHSGIPPPPLHPSVSIRGPPSGSAPPRGLSSGEHPRGAMPAPEAASGTPPGAPAHRSRSSSACPPLAHRGVVAIETLPRVALSRSSIRGTPPDEPHSAILPPKAFLRDRSSGVFAPRHCSSPLARTLPLASFPGRASRSRRRQDPGAVPLPPVPTVTVRSMALSPNDRGRRGARRHAGRHLRGGTVSGEARPTRAAPLARPPSSSRPALTAHVRGAPSEGKNGVGSGDGFAGTGRRQHPHRDHHTVRAWTGERGARGRA